MKECSNVGELIEALKEWPIDTKLVADGADSGGYDVTYLPRVIVKSLEESFHPENKDFVRFARHKVVFLIGTGNPPTQSYREFDDWWDIFKEEESEE